MVAPMTAAGGIKMFNTGTASPSIATAPKLVAPSRVFFSLWRCSVNRIPWFSNG